MNELTRSQALFERAQRVIPGGVPGIRAPENSVPGAYPILLERGSGGRVTDVDGNEYVDLLLGYSPIILGHGEETVDRAAAECAGRGFCLNLPEAVMIELAERLVSIVPSAEQALFFKTGSDATTAAIRIARTHTGRSRILRCGYHGWHDWCLEADPGVPESVTESVESFAYNDLDELADRLARRAGEFAGVILTPIGHDFDRQIEPPAPGFLEGVRRLADDHGALLIFDEVRTGFRVHLGGAQALYGVTPDLTSLGKAMANGYPITALVGRAEVMAASRSTFISSTYFGSSMDMAAALVTLGMLEREDGLASIRRKGESFHRDLAAVVAETGLPVTLSPYPEMPFLYFDPALEPDQPERRDRFYGALARAGVFAHPRHHGFLCARHSQRDLDRVLEACRGSARAL